jgi:hypothetical protein
MAIPKRHNVVFGLAGRLSGDPFLAGSIGRYVFGFFPSGGSLSRQRSCSTTLSSVRAPTELVNPDARGGRANGQESCSRRDAAADDGRFFLRTLFWAAVSLM